MTGIDDNPGRRGTFSYRAKQMKPDRRSGVYIDGEYVGSGEEVEVRSGHESEFVETDE